MQNNMFNYSGLPYKDDRYVTFQLILKVRLTLKVPSIVLNQLFDTAIEIAIVENNKKVALLLSYIPHYRFKNPCICFNIFFNMGV
jgi:hypothetical protein